MKFHFTNFTQSQLNLPEMKLARKQMKIAQRPIQRAAQIGTSDRHDGPKLVRHLMAGKRRGAKTARSR